jgi:hyperosmotically inducible protein
MRVLIALVLGIAIGVAAIWFLTNSQGKSAARSTGEQIENATKSARDTIQEKLRVLDLRPEDIKNDLEQKGQVVRRKAREAGQAISDATADARITAAIKGKLLANKDLSALSISVNTTGGVVTLSGTVTSPDDIGKAMLLAMESDGVREVVSTLQVKPK